MPPAESGRRCHDELRQRNREITAPPFLPRRDDRSRAPRRRRRPRARSRTTADARSTRRSVHRPGAGRPAPLAAGRPEPRDPREAHGAERGPRQAARGASSGDERSRATTPDRRYDARAHGASCRECPGTALGAVCAVRGDPVASVETMASTRLRPPGRRLHLRPSRDVLRRDPRRLVRRAGGDGRRDAVPRERHARPQRPARAPRGGRAPLRARSAASARSTRRTAR